MSIARHSAAFRRTNCALFAAGFGTFALLYCVQPLLPLFSALFHQSPAGASLILSAATLTLAGALLVASAASEAYGRKRVMVASLAAAALLTGASAAAPGFATLVGFRAATGVALAGLPAVSLAYVAEEMAPSAAGMATGLFIGGSAIGGMGGRLLAAAIAEAANWRAALAVIAAVSLVCALLLARFLPASRHFHARPFRPGALIRAYGKLLRNPVLPWLFAEAFLLMGGFVTAYNYLPYRLALPPFALSQSVIGLLFSAYAAGVVSSVTAGHLAHQHGRRRVFWIGAGLMALGLALTLSPSLAVIIAGLILLTAGFFAAHAVASGWVAFRAPEARAQAAALYLFFYYCGSSVVGTAGGGVWHRAGWPGVASLIGVLLVAACLIPLLLPTRPASVPPGR